MNPTPSSPSPVTVEAVRRLLAINDELWTEETTQWRHDLYQEAHTLAKSLLSGEKDAVSATTVQEKETLGEPGAAIEPRAVQGPMELLPCPFCGESPTTVLRTNESTDNAYQEIACENTNCPAQPLINENLNEDDGDKAWELAADRAFNAWNQRATPSVGAAPKSDSAPVGSSPNPCDLKSATTFQGKEILGEPGDVAANTVPGQMARQRDSTDTRRYVVGFMFDFAFEHVALIRKNKPAWQAGKLNGIGGKIEGNETPEQAMAREGNEEAGIEASWNHFCSLSGTNNDGGPFQLEALWTYGDLKLVSPQETEEIEILPLVNVAGARSEMIGNLPWLIEMARDFGTSSTAPRFVTARYGPSSPKATESAEVTTDLGEKEAVRRNTHVRQMERQHVLASAGYWFKGSRKAQDEGKLAEAVAFMENAYNHVENALAATNEFISRYFIQGALRFPDGRTYREHAKELLSLTGGQPEDASGASSPNASLPASVEHVEQGLEQCPECKGTKFHHSRCRTRPPLAFLQHVEQEKKKALEEKET